MSSDQEMRFVATVPFAAKPPPVCGQGQHEKCWTHRAEVESTRRFLMTHLAAIGRKEATAKLSVGRAEDRAAGVQEREATLGGVSITLEPSPFGDAWEKLTIGNESGTILVGPRRITFKTVNGDRTIGLPKRSRGMGRVWWIWNEIFNREELEKERLAEAQERARREAQARKEAADRDAAKRRAHDDARSGFEALAKELGVDGQVRAWVSDYGRIDIRLEKSAFDLVSARSVLERAISSGLLTPGKKRA